MLRGTRSTSLKNPRNPTRMNACTRTGDLSKVHPMVLGLLEDHLNNEVCSRNIPKLEGNQTIGLGGMEHSEQGEVHAIGLGRQLVRQKR